MDERRYDIDCLRVIAIALLLLYHVGIGFQPWGVFIGFIQNDEALDWMWVPMSMLNIWRIPILFFVSGMGVCFAMKKRGWKALLLERTRRILVPMLFGMLAIVPLHVLIFQKYYHQDLQYIFNPVHLWFLGNIFIYVLLAFPLLYLLKKNSMKKWAVSIKALFAHPLSVLIVIAFFVAETLIVKPESYAFFAMTWHGFAIGFMSFLFGYLLIYSGEAARQSMIKWRFLNLILALGFFLVRYLVFEFEAAAYLIAIESVFWMFSVFGFAFAHLDRPGKILQYLSQAAYPVYILHMLFLYLGSAWFMPMELPGFLKFSMVALFTFGGCLLTYEFLIRRVKFIRPLFGLKYQ